MANTTLRSLTAIAGTALDNADLFLTHDFSANTEYKISLSELRTAIGNVGSGSIIISSTNSSDSALRITQTGTGNALVVEDSANPDSSPFVVTSTGNVGIGTSTPGGKLSVIGKTTIGDVTTSHNQLTINGGHVNDGDNDYGLTINSFEPAITLLDRSTGAGSVQLFGTNNGGLWLVGDTTNDGTIGHSTNTTDFLLAKFESVNTIFYTSGVESMRINSVGNVGIGTASPNADAKLQIDSTTQGFLPPRMTTTQRNAIVAPVPAGLMIYNTTTNKLNFYNGTAWEAVTSA